MNLTQILKLWIINDPWLKLHFAVYGRTEFEWLHSEWPDIVDDADAFIGMSCDGANVGLAIMDDHVYFKDHDSGPKHIFYAADPDFFYDVKKDLYEYHFRTHKGRKCKLADMV